MITAEQYMMENMQGADFQEIESALIGFATLKCKELLLLVAEKAELEIKSDGLEKTVSKTYETYSRGGHGEPNWCTRVVVDKDSIVNAIDLEKFCS